MSNLRYPTPSIPQDPKDLEARLSKLRLRVAAEGRARAAREIDRAITQAKGADGGKHG
jgi:hypothetical protein